MDHLARGRRMDGTTVFVPDEVWGWLPAVTLPNAADVPTGSVRVQLEVPSWAAHVAPPPPTGERTVPLPPAGKHEGALSDASASGDGGAAAASAAPPTMTLPMRDVDAPVGGVADMVAMTRMHEPAILENVRARFHAAQPYTHVGELVIAVNPYRYDE